MTTSAELQALAARLQPHHEMFLAFARKRVADPGLAADAVQDSLLKAIKSSGQLRDDESVVPWFYRILRRTILNLYRRREARQRVLVEMPEEFEAVASEEEKASICGCLRGLLPTLKPEYAQVIEAVDLGEGSVERIAGQLGVSRNNLNVRLHRARAQLRERLVQTCASAPRTAASIATVTPMAMNSRTQSRLRASCAPPTSQTTPATQWRPANLPPCSNRWRSRSGSLANNRHRADTEHWLFHLVRRTPW